MNVSQKLIQSHLVEGVMEPGKQIALEIDQTLTQDATGTLVILELEAMGIDRVKTECSVQYVDHNLLQEDYKNPDDHLFLESGARRFGLWFSRPGTGVSHPVHQERFGIPGKTLLGSDSHTPAAGAIGMLAIGSGGLEVALAMAGHPLNLEMPKIWGVELEGRLRDWVSAKDVILELLRRHGVDGGVNCILEYFGTGLESLSAWDRHVIANMGTELGATSSVFPSDNQVLDFLSSQGRAEDWVELKPDSGAEYDRLEKIQLDDLEPLIAMPSSPDNVKPVREVAGQPIYQAYIGSSANPGYRDFAVVAEMLGGKKVHERVSLDINPSTRQILQSLIREGHLLKLVGAGGRIHQTGCNGCIGMGQAPATGKLSLRTVPRNFPGRSGTREDKVCLTSPETAAASALRGEITDPRTLGIPYPRINEPESIGDGRELLVPPLALHQALQVELVKGPNIASFPELDPVDDKLDVPAILKVGDNISTDEILPAGSRVLPYRSNIPKISQFAFEGVDPEYAGKAHDSGLHAIVGGRNYGQGSSREHAALAPRVLGLVLVIAKSFARIHRRNLLNFGVVPLTFSDASSYDAIDVGDQLVVENLWGNLLQGTEVEVINQTQELHFKTRHSLSPREKEILRSGGLINWVMNSDN